MELKLRKCYFLGKFNKKKIITPQSVAFHFRYSFCRQGWVHCFDSQKILSRCGRCGFLMIQKIFVLKAWHFIWLCAISPLWFALVYILKGLDQN